MKNSLVKDAIALCLITLVAGLLLGFVYELTKAPIEAAKVKEKKEAYQAVFSTAVSFFDENQYYIDVATTSGEILVKEANISGVTIEEILEAYDGNDTLLGYVISSTSHDGYGGDVPITIGVFVDGEISGLEVLDNSETSGFGSKAKEPWFKEQFVGISEQLVAPNVNFDGISGATRTTSAITNAINGALYYVHNKMVQ